MAHFIRRGQANFNSRFHAAVHSSHTEPRSDFRNSPLVRASRVAALAHDAERALARIPLATAEGYDRSAIMRVALAEAREVRGRGSLKPWRELIGSALRMAWLRAKLARSVLIAQAAH
jgi:hypothetical protein